MLWWIPYVYSNVAVMTVITLLVQTNPLSNLGNNKETTNTFGVNNRRTTTEKSFTVTQKFDQEQTQIPSKNLIKQRQNLCTIAPRWLQYFDHNCKQQLHAIVKCICGCQGDAKCSPCGTIRAWWCNYGRCSPPAQHPHIKARKQRFTCNGPHAMTLTNKGLHSMAPQTNKGPQSMTLTNKVPHAEVQTQRYTNLYEISLESSSTKAYRTPYRGRK